MNPRDGGLKEVAEPFFVLSLPFASGSNWFMIRHLEVTPQLTSAPVLTPNNLHSNQLIQSSHLIQSQPKNLAFNPANPKFASDPVSTQKTCIQSSRNRNSHLIQSVAASPICQLTRALQFTPLATCSDLLCLRDLLPAP